MVGVHAWSLVLLALCHSCLSRSGASVSIIERDVEPVTFVTSAATPDSEPMWIVLPMLLDVQPVLLKVDVARHVPAQIQSFCRDHGVHTTSCTGAIREALDDVVNFQRFCKKPNVESVLPGFVVTKNVIHSDGGSASGSWLQNDPEDVAIDFCSFTEARTKVTKRDECIKALEKTLRLSFDWILALTPCEQDSSSSPEEMTSDSETQSVADRLATVEEMIAALQSTSARDEEIPQITEEPVDDSSVSFSDESAVAEEISEAEEPEIVTTEQNIVNMQEYNMEIAPSVTESTSADVDELHDQTDPDEYIGDAHDESAELEELNGAEAEEEGQDAVKAVIATKMAEEDNLVERTEAGNGSREASYATLQEEEPSRISEEQKSRETWKVGAALVLALSIVYLAIDLMLHCVQHVAGHLELSKQFVNLQHDISLLVGRSPRSTSKIANSSASGSEDFKKPMLRQSKVSSEKKLSQSNHGSRSVEAATQKSSMKRRATALAPHYPSPSFTCVAMMLMTSRNDSILAKTKKLPTSSLVHDCNEALSIIEKKYERELVAAQRIQNAWKAAQRKNGLGKFDTNARIHRLIQQKSKPTEQPPRVETGSTGLCRLIVNTLPPTA